MAPEKVVYVSCDSSTLARDVKYLGENGYEVKRVRTVDMFGMSGHVETVALLTKNAYTVISWEMKMNQDPFKEYIRESEPNKREKGYAWQTAIGLQAVDGLKTSKYLIDTAIRNIEGDISIDEANSLLNSYYEENPKQDPGDRTEEADKVSVRIVKVLSETGFSFTPNEYISIHKKLFTGIYRHAGKIRDYNITKKEWILDGETVLYGNASELRDTLEYDFSEERTFSYKGLSINEIIHHLAVFVSRLWQIHILRKEIPERRSIFIKYLRTLGLMPQ